ncbi:hypothetical protein ABZS66_52255 [Dactylosporangium sp. NPDC005572]|uniref:hypothetical protein n=1 Tax=Dactylosporangium sp. NPDC005572 TaxID=3156889 RepID=UPI0033B78EAF
MTMTALGITGNGDADAIEPVLTALGVDTGALRRLPRWNGAGLRLPSAQESTAVRAAVADVLDAQLPAVAGYEPGVPLLLAFLLAETESAWNVSYHYQPLWQTLAGATAYVEDHPDVVPAGARRTVEVVCLQMRVVDLEIRAENAMGCGDLDRAVAYSRQAVELAGRVLELVPEVPQGDPDLRELLRNRALTAQQYDTGTAHAAGSVARFFAGDPSALDPAIAGLAEAEASPAMPGHAERSCMKAHRLSLEALRAQRDGEWARVDEGLVTYVYPFAVRGLSAQAAVERARTAALGWTLGGVQPTGVRESLDLDDMWDGADSLGRRYEGAVLELPDVVRYDEDGVETGRLRAEVRLSELGNHYVRFEADLLDASPHDVNTAMFLAAPECGAGRIGFAAESAAPRLSDFATGLAHQIGQHLGRAGDGTGVVARPGMFHVVVSVYAASVVGPGGAARPVHTFAELSAGAGSQVLTNPIHHTTGSVAEWARFPARPEGMPGTVSVVGDHVCRTANTTAVVMLASPEFSAENRASVAEFVAALDGLFTGWLSEIGSHYQHSVDLQRDITRAVEQQLSDLDELTRLARRLDQVKSALHAFAIEARSTIATIESPSLVAAPGAAAIVSAFLDASKFAARARDLNAKIDQVLEERLQLLIGQLAARRAEQEAVAEARLERSRRARLDTMLAIIAAVGVSGLAQIVQNGYDIKHVPALIVTLAVLLFSVAVGVLVWSISSRRSSAAATRAPLS